ncbi:MAG: stage II sporulation protein P [Ruminococcus sp.]|nr:stage II sporulation protein P [Ruminococcus sp.]
MRKRRSRRKSLSGKRRKIFLCCTIAAALLIGIVCRQSDLSAQQEAGKTQPLLSADILTSGNVHNEAYVDLQKDAWNPLEDDSLEVNAQDPTESASEADYETDGGDKPYPTEWNVSDQTEIIRTTFGQYSGTKFISLPTAGQVGNYTELENSVLLEECTMSPAFKISVNNEPQVLIMHTHTTESYEPYVREHFDPTFNYRTTDNEKNVVAVGEVIAEKLREAGIGVIHSDAVHDYPSYNGAYERSAETVTAILEQYPSIRVVLDIHRDAIGTDTAITQPVVEINGKEAAQIMIISGCDDGTMDMPNYMFNFRFACRLQEQMENMYPGLTRPILFDYRRYNQNLTTGSLLIEVGSHGSTLDQALYAGALFGDALVQVLLDLH